MAAAGCKIFRREGKWKVVLGVRPDYFSRFGFARDLQQGQEGENSRGLEF